MFRTKNRGHCSNEGGMFLGPILSPPLTLLGVRGRWQCKKTNFVEECRDMCVGLPVGCACEATVWHSCDKSSFGFCRHLGHRQTKSKSKIQFWIDFHHPSHMRKNITLLLRAAGKLTTSKPRS